MSAWLVAGVPAVPRSTGGSLRAHHLFAALAARTGATMASTADGRIIGRALLRRPRLRTHLASARLISPRTLRFLSLVTDLAILDFPDHPTLQTDALGVATDPGARERVGRVVADNLARFGRVVVPSASFAELYAIPAAQRIVICNGTDPEAIRPEPLPDGPPTVALVSGAAPGRGIDLLIAAVRGLRSRHPDLRLAMALSATGAASQVHLDELTAAAAGEPWMEVARVAYPEIGGFLARATVVAIPHPPGAYFDAAPPVKLFDAMAAGRPLVVTPRVEMRRIVQATGCGVVAAGDETDDLAAAIGELIGSRERAKQMGAAGRRAAEREYDWRVLSAQLADEILA